MTFDNYGRYCAGVHNGMHDFFRHSNSAGLVSIYATLYYVDRYQAKHSIISR